MSQLNWRMNRWCAFGPAGVVALVAVLLLAIPAFGQLTSGDIKVLQERAKVEGWTFTVGENSACQYTLKELCGFDAALDPKDNLVSDPVPASDRDLPSRFDWRDSVCLPIAKDQAGCGSCWAFASAGMLECNIALKDGLTSIDLSEQWLLSCNPYGYNCENGGFDISGMFLTTADSCGGKGAVLEADFPYIESNGTCHCPYDHHYWIESRGSVGSTIAAMKQAIIDYGPIYVSVTANETTWPAYTGGVYNLDDPSSTNHAVCLVGWDDTQGTAGVWFMRNSWGAWGENNGYTCSGRGYMRIEYGCCNIGNNPKRLYYQPVNITADVRLGARPLTVNFTAVAPRDTVTDATWSFGDGQYAEGAAVTNQYTQPGLYSVVTLVETPRGTMGDTSVNFIGVYADTMAVASVTGDPGADVKVDVSVHNFLPLKEITIPFTWTGTKALVFDSFVVTGLRTAYFEHKTLQGFQPSQKRATVNLNCSNSGAQPYLAAGTGPVVSLWFSIPAGATSGINPIAILDTTVYSYHPKFNCILGDYKPAFKSGSVQIGSASCCVGPTVGNIDMSTDLLITMSDLTVLIDHLYITLTPLACLDAGNIDLSSDKLVTMGDMTVLIDHLFITLAPLAPCP